MLRVDRGTRQNYSIMIVNRIGPGRPKYYVSLRPVSFSTELIRHTSPKLAIESTIMMSFAELNVFVFLFFFREKTNSIKQMQNNVEEKKS